MIRNLSITQSKIDEEIPRIELEILPPHPKSVKPLKDESWRMDKTNFPIDKVLKIGSLYLSKEHVENKLSEQKKRISLLREQNKN